MFDDVDEDDWDREYEEGLDELDEAIEECGLLPPHLGGGCQFGGTEHCDFECPFRDHPEWLLGEGDDEDDDHDSHEAQATEPEEAAGDL